MGGDYNKKVVCNLGTQRSRTSDINDVASFFLSDVTMQNLHREILMPAKRIGGIVFGPIHSKRHHPSPVK